MKRIGLIGTTEGAEAIEYFKYIINITAQQTSDFNQNNIFIYSTKLYKDEEEGNNVVKLWDAIFHMMHNNVHSIILCNHKLEKLLENIDTENIPTPPVLQSGRCVSDEINKLKCNKLAIFTTTITAELDYFLTFLKNRKIELRLLSEADRKRLEQIIFEYTFAKKLTIPTQNLLSSWCEKLPGYGIEGILVDSPLLYSFLQQLSFNLPIFYSRKIHAKETAALILS